MMDALRAWLSGVCCAALLVTLVQRLLPKGKLKNLASLTGGLILLLTVLRPLGVGRSWSWDASAFQAKVEARQAELEAERQARLAAIIAEEAEAYIWEKGEALGLEAPADVEVREADGVLLPWRAELGCPYDEALSRAVAELGIPRERQRYEGE